MMNEHGKSDGFIVSEKSPNKARPMAAEGMEGRNPTKGNPSQQNTSRTQRRADVNNALPFKEMRLKLCCFSFFEGRQLPSGIWRLCFFNEESR